MPEDNMDDVANISGGTATATDDKTTTDTTTSSTDTSTSTTTAFKDEDAVEIATMLADAGYTKANIQNLLATPQIVSRLSNMLENDPQEFFKYIERQSPQVAAKFLNKLTDIYIDRYNEEDASEGEGKGGKPDREPAWARELREQNAQILQENQNRRAQEHYAAVQSTYHQKVDAYIDKLPGDLSARDKRSIKLWLNDSIGSDAGAVTRINNGSFLDIPRHLNKVLAEFNEKTTDAATKNADAREKVAKNASKENTNAAAASATSVNAADSWDETEKAFANALTKAKK
jgi:hypothetical protein